MRVLKVMGLALYGMWLAVGALTALFAELLGETVAERVQAGAATLAVAIVFAGALVVSRFALLARAVGAVAVVAAAIAAGGVALASWPGNAILVAAIVALVAALGAVGSRRVLPSLLEPGPTIGAGLVAGGVAAVVGTVGLMAVLRTLQAASPLWNAPLLATGPHPPLQTWQLPVSIVAVSAAITVLVPLAYRATTIASGLALGLMAVSGSMTLPWWAPAVLSLAGAAVATTAMLLDRTSRTAGAAGVIALVLILDAVSVSVVRPALSAAVFAGTAALGLAVAVVGTAGEPRPGRAVMTRVGMFVCARGPARGR
jgi:hypothetical protein